MSSAVKDVQVEKESHIEQKTIATNTLKSAYDQLKIGMSYDECVAMLGSNGELFSESETEHLGKSSIYLWKPEGELFAGIEAYFDNDKLSSKTWVE